MEAAIPYASFVPPINSFFVVKNVQATSFAVIPHLLVLVDAELANCTSEFILAVRAEAINA